MAKPIFIIMMPADTSADLIKSMPERLHTSMPEFKDEYYTLICYAKVDVVDFKLLNGTQENYDSIEEIKAKVLEIL